MCTWLMHIILTPHIACYFEHARHNIHDVRHVWYLDLNWPVCPFSVLKKHEDEVYIMACAALRCLIWRMCE